MTKAILFIHDLNIPYDSYQKFIEDMNYIHKIHTHYFVLVGHKNDETKKITYKDWLKQAETELVQLLYAYNDVSIIGHGIGALIGSDLSHKYSMVQKLILVGPIIKMPKNITKQILKIPLSMTKTAYKMIKEKKDVIRKIKCPVLLIQGEQDEFVKLETIYQIFDTIKSPKSMVMVKKGKHQLFKEERVQIEACITTFLNKKRYKKKYDYQEL